MDEFGLDNLDITRDELTRITRAFKNDEFKKLFADYCEEINDPENRRRYEEELTQLEAERGIDITFINPEPGYVIKTSANGTKKVFINVCKSSKISAPSSSCGTNADGQPGLNWSLPYSQAPPRNDLDKKNDHCVVYDVVFHPDTLHLAEKNVRFRQLVNDTACEAVQTAYNVQLDLNNLRFPKIAYKGRPRPTVTRKRSANPPPAPEPSPIDHIYPPLKDVTNSNSISASKSNVPTELPTSKNPKHPESSYTIPKYEITHRHGVEYHQMTDELDAKINATIPTELIVAIHLPLLNSTVDVILDVTERKIFLRCDTPVKYKLDLQLPYEVCESNGAARFDKAARKLTITLPVTKKNHLNMSNVIGNGREDSGVDSDNGSPKSQEYVTEIDAPKNVPEFTNDSDCISADNSPSNETIIAAELEPSGFLDQSISYLLPSFTCDLAAENMAAILTLNVKNVDSESIVISNNHKMEHCNFVQMKFHSIGSGFYPIHYAFAIQFPDSCNGIVNVEAEAWDNNVIVQIELNGGQLESYLAGLDKNDLQSFEIGKKLEVLCEPPHANETNEAMPKSILEIKSESVRIASPNMEEQSTDESKPSKSKKNKKKNRKIRSFSESHCENLFVEPKADGIQPRKASIPEPINNYVVQPQHLKSRSLSESSTDDPTAPKIREIKSILKRRSSYNRSISESSVDEHHSGYGGRHGSIDLGVVGSIPEEGGQEMSESVKKTVRFDNQIRKQLYKIRSSIVGQRKPQASKRKKKKHSQDGRSSEGESSDYESPRNGSDSHCNGNSNESAAGGGNKKNKNRKNSTSGCSSDDAATSHASINATTKYFKTMQLNDSTKMKQSNLSSSSSSSSSSSNPKDLHFKCDMIFDIEM